ncbi:hypothetical protein L5F46_05940 [Aliarcobacter butzleri]|uniref:hypothetical protein n=1 Tax=Aliarcobacter butzleri TaxID=28197 RepID=UPI001EE102C5|nr:hypothetical protein [Aliarcobacter butzleri]MCG3674316.1 hypothetical protein [Aliarcobacter butzleri]
MWHIKLSNINEEQFEVLQNVISEKIYFKSFQIKEHEYKEYYLILENQEIKSAPEALSKGEDEIKVLASILNIFDYKNSIIANSPYEIHPDGTRTGYLTFVDKINITDEVNIYSNNELIYSTKEDKKESIKDIYLKSKDSEIKKQLLVYMAKDENWINAYKIYEILKHHYTTEKELKEYSELSTFAHTANSPNAVGEDARHAVQNTQNPKNIANLQASYKKLKELAIKFLME